MTQRLYYRDSYLKEFKARILKKVKISNQSAVILDRTAFYPTSGGQPFDKGVIQDTPVVEVVEEGEKIVHILREEIEEEINSEVVGRIDWERRFDHMQQHLGQHILSGALMKLWGAETVSFHLGEEVCTLDMSKEKFTEEEAKKAEECANEVIFNNRPVRCYFVEREEDLRRLDLRKIPNRKEGKLRIVEVENFDLSACGGTHCRTTGEVGIIKIIKWEKRGEKIRLEFICGRRAWEDYFWKNELIKNISNKLTIKDSELNEVIDRILEERKEIRKELKEFKERLQTWEARDIINELSLESGKVKIVKKVFEEKNFQEIRELVQKIIDLNDRMVVLFGVKDAGARILFACSRGLKYDMSGLVREAGKFIEGRGGGAPNFAQAGGKKAEGIDKALDFALKNLRNFVKE